MIAALLNTEDPKKESILLVLEPSNIEKLQLGQAIVKLLNDFLPDLPVKIELCIAFTPDIVWTGVQLKRGRNLADTLQASITRTPVYSRTLDPEALAKNEIKEKE